MFTLLQRLLDDEAGFIVSAEIVIILTIGVIGMVVGLASIQHALLGEFADLGLAFQALNQSYSTPTYRGCMKWGGWGGRTSWVSGSAFYDVYDGCAGFGNAVYDIGGYGGYAMPAVGGTTVGGSAVINDPSCVTTPGVVEPGKGTPAIPQATPQCTTCP